MRKLKEQFNEWKLVYKNVVPASVKEEKMTIERELAQALQDLEIRDKHIKTWNKKGKLQVASSSVYTTQGSHLPKCITYSYMSILSSG